MQDNFLKRIITKPPFLFPWIAGAHLLMVIYTIWLYHTEPFPSIGWLQPLWALGFTISWLFVCDLKKWAAYTYLALTSADLLIYYFVKYPGGDNPYATILLLAYLVIFFSFLVLFFFKKFEK